MTAHSHPRVDPCAGAAGSLTTTLAAGGNLRDAIRSEIAFARLEDKLRHARLPWWARWFGC